MNSEFPFGSVADLSLMDLIVSATTGEDDAEAIKGVVRQLGMDISGRLENLYDDIPIEYERYGTASYKEMQELRWELFQAMSSVRYTYDENAFYEQLIKAHNTCIRLRDQGVKHPTIDYFIKLADPTLLHIIRLMFFSLMATFDNMLVIPKSANLYWDLLQAELAKGSEINNTGNILP